MDEGANGREHCRSKPGFPPSTPTFDPKFPAPAGELGVAGSQTLEAYATAGAPVPASP